MKVNKITVLAISLALGVLACKANAQEPERSYESLTPETVEAMIRVYRTEFPKTCRQARIILPLFILDMGSHPSPTDQREYDLYLEFYRDLVNAGSVANKPATRCPMLVDWPNSIITGGCSDQIQSVQMATL